MLSSNLGCFEATSSGRQTVNLTTDLRCKDAPILKFFHLQRVQELRGHRVLELFGSHFTDVQFQPTYHVSRCTMSVEMRGFDFSIGQTST